MTGQVVKFKGAALPSMDINKFQKQLAARSQQLGDKLGSGGKHYLKMAKNDGYWIYGAKQTEVEGGSHWAVNPMSLQMGYVSWKSGRPAGKRMASVFSDAIDQSMLEDVGAKWDEAVAFDLTCISGEDVGTVCEYSANSYGGRAAFKTLMDEIIKQSGVNPAMIVPIIELESESYEHAEYGTTYNPVFKIVDWAAFDGSTSSDEASEEQEQQPEQPPEPEAQPARRGRGAAPAAQQAAERTRGARRGAAAAAAVPAAAAAQPVQRGRRRAT